MDEYHLSPDELIAKIFARSKALAVATIRMEKAIGSLPLRESINATAKCFAGYLQDNYPHLYNQGTWLFGDWDNALREAGFEPGKMRMIGFWDEERVIREIHGLRKNNLPSMPSTF